MAKINFSTSLDLIKQPLTTLKTSQLFEKNQYTFLVDPKLDKPTIKKAIEFLFSVKIIKINTCNLPKKTRRVGQLRGIRPRYKKVVVKLAKENTIDFFSSDSIIV
uniref:Large ribosomal subunit protein uL23c n=1 Tax=Dictyopteris divaricata TaxID=156996 RepID=A0A2I4Q2I3_9PHAE|nr:50S ribosomal protein L23 [Dictyopteris divaricata]YP_010205333.1 50S ribosomal protein L23 [Grateloupia livida]AQZ25044.1 50S ribosomal protein L23 [Dictyopteris divaricata]UAV85902.1 50S ribosomal protein L23 [Grateloupia livida]